MGTTTCTRCGAALRPEISYCVRCGASVSGQGPGGVPEPVQAVAVFDTPVPTAPVTPVASSSAPVSTPTAPIVVDRGPREARDRMRRVVLAGTVALVLTLIARVGYSAMSAEPAADGEIIARLPVGPDGGKATFDDGGKIKVPKGALTERRTITVRRSVIRDRVRAISPFGGSIVIPAGAQTIYIFGPVDITFLRAVTIVLPLPPPPDQGIVFVSANGQISFIQANTGDRTISIRVTSFRFDRAGTFV
jgi:hypothetical protein